MSFTPATFIKIGKILIVVLTIILGALYFLGGSRTSNTQVPTDTGTDTISVRPDMSAFIIQVFDSNSDAVAYDWAVVAADESSPQESFIETSSFTIGGQGYEFLLSTLKAQPTDETYTIPDYLALTLTLNTAQGTDQIVYIDLGADGILDSVYLNDVAITDEAAFKVAESQYLNELYVAGDHVST